MTTRPLGAAVRYIRTLTDGRAAATDGQLLDRFARFRDEAAFTAILRRHAPMVLAVCRRVLGRLPDAEDAFQATFLLLARKAASIRKKESVGSWLHGVARRLALKAKGRDDRRRLFERRAGIMGKPENSVQAAWSDLQETVDEALQRLPEHYRTALVICHLEGRTHEEAARQLGCPLSTLRSRLTRGRKLLRTKLTRRGLTLSAGALGAALLVSSAEAAPPLLLDATLKAALLFAAGITAAAVSASAAALAKEGLKAMGIMKTKIVVMLLAALSLVGAGVGALAQPAAKPPEVKPPETKAAAAPVAKDDGQVRLDDFGDPLPDGAVRRVGTLRFRQGGGLWGYVIPAPDGKAVLSGFIDGNRTICSWDLATGKLRHSFPTGTDQTIFALSPDGRFLVESHQSEWVIHLWDTATGKELPRLQRADGCFPDSFAFSPDGKTLAVGSSQFGVFLWDLTTGKHTVNLKTPREMIRGIAFTPDGKTLVASAGAAIIQWDAASHEELRTLTRPKEIFHLALSPDGALLASVGAGGATDGIALWDLKDGKVVREWPTAAAIHSLVFSPDGNTLLSAESDGNGSTLVLRDVRGGKDQRFKSPGLARAAFSTDGKTIISCHIGGAIRLWDADTGKERGPAMANQRMAELTLSPDGRTLAFHRDKEECRDDREILLWDMAAGREIGAFPTERWSEGVMNFAPDGKTLATVSGATISLWDVGTRKLIRRFQQSKINNGYLCGSSFAPDGKSLATGDSDGYVRLWNLADDKELRRLLFTSSDKKNAEHGVSLVAFAPDGRKLAALGWTHGLGVRMRLWDFEPHEESSELIWETTTADMPHDDGQLVIVQLGRLNFMFSPDGRNIAVSRWQTTIPIWETASGKERLVLAGHAEPTTCIAMSRDGRTLASSSLDETIRLWELETGEELRTLTGHRGPANSLVFSADGATLISTGNDTTMLFWDVAAVTHRPRPQVTPLSADRCEALWADLASADAAKAYRAIRAFSVAPAQTPAFIGKRLRPAPAADKADMDRWIAALDSDDFEEREKATHKLDEISEAARPALLKVLEGQPSAEVRSRASQLLKKLAAPAGELLRQLRAVEALEAVGGPEARAVLARIAEGAAESRLTREASASLERRARRQMNHE